MEDWEKSILEKWAGKKKKTSVITDVLRDRLARETRAQVFYNESMKKHTSIRIGGVADIYIEPADYNDLLTTLKIAEEENVPTHFLGWGSNSLVKDGGIRGMVVSSSPALMDWSVVSETEEYIDVCAGAGVGINSFVNKCADLGLTGMESLVGIPGSMGGAIFMNAGARGTEIKDLVREITVLTVDGEIKKISREKLDFSYRSLKIPKTHFILNGTFRLNKGDKIKISEEIREYQKKRVDTQPLNYPNLGSVFKNPEPTRKGEIVAKAGQLIEECGLKNVRVGGARVSDKHANFIINEKDATAKDVLVLIHLVKDKVKEATGIVLECEVKIIGEDA